MLVLAEPEREIWERFVSTGRAYVAGHPVLARWKRALALGVSADRIALPSGVDGARLVERRERSHVLLEESAEIVEPMASELGSHGLVALLTDVDGVILHSHGGGAFVSRATRARLVEGARWDEPERGTNAIGTAIAEKVPVCVVGRAHYERENHGLVCYASPLKDAFGRVVGVLDVSGPVEAHNPLVKLAVLTSGRAIERSLVRRAFTDAVPGGFDVLVGLLDRSRVAALLVDAQGKMIHANDRATTLVGSDLARLGGSIGAACTVRGKTISSREIEVGTRTFRAALEPIFTRDGAALATVVYLEPSTASVVVSSPASGRVVSADLGPFDAIVGQDASLVAAKASAAKFARTDLPVLLLAETGTGKELFARAIHAGSARARGPFVAINCGAIPETLVASELFGHGAGAFTGARAQGQSGRVAAAAGGTLFLDEIAELPLSAQAALLRFLEDGTFRRVGETEERRVDVRLVYATCRDLGAMVESGAFRRDLFFRIKGARLTLPALRDRTDVRELVAELLVRVAPKGRRFVLSPEAEDALVRHEWPGNVRELKTALQYATALAEDGEIRLEHLPEDVTMTEAPPESASNQGSEAQETTPSRRLAEREALRMALDRARGNMSEAARQLGVARSTLYRMIVRHGVS